MDSNQAVMEVEPGGAEPGLPGEAPPGSIEFAARARRRFTARERLELVEGCRRSGIRAEIYAESRGISGAALRRWMVRHARGGAAALEDRPNPRNLHGRSRGRYSPEERRAILEALAKSGMPVREVARTWGVAVKSLTDWKRRYAESGPKGLEPKPRSPGSGDKQRLAPPLREAIREVQSRFPDFGLRRLRDFLARFRGVAVSPGAIRRTLNEAGVEPLPGPTKAKRRKPMPPRRFERASPGSLWQSDITSYLLTRHSTRVYLTVFLDDHSRYVVSWMLATHQRQELVTETLMEGIARFGKPKEVLTDQGRQYFAWRGKSAFQQLLEREGIEHVVARTHHPQTLGKCERLWETINVELWSRARPQDLTEARLRLAHWFAHYNHFRPHQGIEGMVPADRFFGVTDEVRARLESQFAENELQLALGEPLKKPVFLFGQIGDQSVSLHGERGRLVLQTSYGDRKEVGLEEIGMPEAGEEKSNGVERSGEGGGTGRAAQADAAVQEAGGVSAAETGDRGEGAVGAGERGGENACAPDVCPDARALAGAKDEGGDGDGAGIAAVAGVAIEPIGAFGHAGGSLEATEDAPAWPSTECGDERIAGAAQGERAVAQGAGSSAGGERAVEGPALEPSAEVTVAERGDVGRGKKGEGPSSTTKRAAEPWASGCLSEESSLEECWLALLERSE